MSWKTYQEYDKISKYMDRLLSKRGEPCTIFIPDSLRETGYEDLTPEQLKKETGVLKVGTKYTRINTICFINFKVTKSVFYRYNWFPENSEELCMCFFPDTQLIKEDTFVRTAQPECVSKYGDLIFRVSDIKADGLYRHLRKIYFLRPVSSSEVQNKLVLGSSGSLFI